MYLFLLRTVQGSSGVQDCLLSIVKQLGDVLQGFCRTLKNKNHMHTGALTVHFCNKIDSRNLILVGFLKTGFNKSYF